MAKDYREAMRILSRNLQGRSESPLGHPTARGDHREALLCQALRERVGNAFAITKAEVVDSCGQSTGEFDAVIYDQRVGACVADNAGRHVVRVEAVAATVEVKSQLRGADLEDLVAKSNKDLIQLQRFFRATPMLDLLGKLRRDVGAEAQATLSKGVNAMMHYQNIPQIVSFVFAFDGITKEAATSHLEFPGVDVICVLGKYTIAKENPGFAANPPGLCDWAHGDDALGAFVFLVEQCLEEFVACSAWVLPAWRRYFFSPEVLQKETRPKFDVPESDPT